MARSAQCCRPRASRHPRGQGPGRARGAEGWTGARSERRLGTAGPSPDRRRWAEEGRSGDWPSVGDHHRGRRRGATARADGGGGAPSALGGRVPPVRGPFFLTPCVSVVPFAVLVLAPRTRGRKKARPAASIKTSSPRSRRTTCPQAGAGARRSGASPGRIAGRSGACWRARAQSAQRQPRLTPVMAALDIRRLVASTASRTASAGPRRCPHRGDSPTW